MSLKYSNCSLPKTQMGRYHYFHSTYLYLKIWRFRFHQPPTIKISWLHPHSDYGATFALWFFFFFSNWGCSHPWYKWKLRWHSFIYCHMSRLTQRSLNISYMLHVYCQPLLYIIYQNQQGLRRCEGGEFCCACISLSSQKQIIDHCC